MRNETDNRLQLLNSLLTCPHRDLQKVAALHAEMAEQDPRFYVRLAAWYAVNGAVRDHREVFCGTLVLSDFEGHRDVGLALLREMPPYQVGRVVDFVHGRVERRRVPVEAGRETRRREARARVRGRAASSGAAVGAAAVAAAPERREVLERTGLFRNLPRSLKTELRRYLREREAKPEWLDDCALTARNPLKRLYALAHIAPGPRAQAILFDDQPPPDSRLYRLKTLARATTPAEQARAIVEHRIPYRVAASVIRQMTPSVVAALVDSMTPQELINNLASLKRRGALDHPELKSLVEAKLERAKSDTRVSAYKAKEAARAAGASEELQAKLDAVTEAQVKARGRISRPTALLVDKSGSMAEAIEIGKRVGAMLGALCEAELYVYTFDTIAMKIDPGGTELASWEKAFAGVKAVGGTSCGVGVERLRRQRQYVEQIVLITDEGENTLPHFVPALQAYREEMKADPSVCIVKTRGAIDLLERQLREAGLAADAFQFDGDYYALPNLVPMLTQPSKLELLQQIVEYPLPKRREG
jgi:hypothetical protein